MENKMMNAKEAAAYLGVSESSIRHWTSQGKVESFKINGFLVRYNAEQLDKIRTAGVGTVRA